MRSHEVVEAIETAADPKVVAKLLRAAMEPLGFVASACGFFEVTRNGPVPTFFFQDWPETWAARYEVDGVANRDAVVLEARRRFRPFTWSETLDGPALKPAEAGTWQDVRDLGWQDGIAVPIHGPGGYFGLLTMASCGRPTGEAMTAMHAIALAAHDRCRRLSGVDAGPGDKQRLTARELECLRWVARGAPDIVIARRIGISALTVKDYVNSARQKIGASNRAHAVAILMAWGVL